MKCPNCGKEIADNSQFCEFCGEKILDSAPKSKRWLLWVAIGVIICSVSAFLIVFPVGSGESISDYVDLGLPSGTLWKNKCEPELYTAWGAKDKFGDRLPKGVQMDELLTYCKQDEVVVNNVRGLSLIGPNGNYIVVYPMGYEARDNIYKNGQLIRTRGETWGISHCGFFLTSSKVGANVGGMEIEDNGGLSAKYSTKDPSDYICSVLLVWK